MKKYKKIISTVLFLGLFQTIFAQVPDLGSASNFAMFTSAGAFSNDGLTEVTGDIGTNVGAFGGFPPGIVVGSIHVANPVTAQAAADLNVAYGSLAALTCGLVIGTTMGNDQYLTPNIYCLGAASVINGDLYLDAGCNPDAVFIFLIDGALSTSNLSNIILINSASLCNVYWQVNGAVGLGENSLFQGNILANGAISLGQNATLLGRGLSVAGAISMHNNLVDFDMLPTPSTITADGPLTFCEGDSVILSGNCGGVWNTGETTESITVKTSGTYFTTNTNSCGETVSNITVTTNPSPDCLITGISQICAGETTQLCVASGYTGYLWSTGETTNCINVTLAGTYSVTVTGGNGCTSSCSRTVSINTSLACSITGSDIICPGQSIPLCVPSGAAGYLWSTLATTNCISINVPGTYSVTITSASGCTSVCSKTVLSGTVPVCSITGNNILCFGQNTTLCATPGATSYLWSNLATTSCIIVGSAGNYSVTITNAQGCTSSCSILITVNPDNLPPDIICPTGLSIQCNASSLPASTGSASATDNCTLAPVITYSDVILSGICPNSYTISRTWLATDLAGNASMCNQTISVIDNLAPQIICPANLSIDCSMSILPANTGTPTGTDNCSASIAFTSSDVLIPGSCPQTYQIQRTWIGTDNCANNNICIQNISVTDNLPPVINFNNPSLTNGGTFNVQCYGQDPNWMLPMFNENSIIAIDNCAGSVTVSFNKMLVNKGDCIADGYINLFRLTWTATDLCGNTSSKFIFMALVDTLAPKINGVPNDVTVECDAIPIVGTVIYGTDECLCACILSFNESNILSGCMNGQTILRSWTAKDACGNITTSSQKITLIDTSGPEWKVNLPDSGNIPDGTILEFDCNEGYPGYLDHLSDQNMILPNSCGASIVVSFDITNQTTNNCKLDGYLEQRTYQWTGKDECGNISTFKFYARLIDKTAPYLVGLPDIGCEGDITLKLIKATDLCSQTFVEFSDFPVLNPCGDGKAISRIYTAEDECGNIAKDTILLLNIDATPPIITIINPLLLDLKLDETMKINCETYNGNFTNFNAKDVKVESTCNLGLNVDFKEILLQTGNCKTDGFVSKILLQWTATDVCGKSSVLNILAQVVDKTSPVFSKFNSEVAVGCQDSIPALFITDNCGEITTTMLDSVITSDCIYEYTIFRTIAATDLCDNTTIMKQIIRVGDGLGPVIEGIIPVICNDLSFPSVTAYDNCEGKYVDVTMVQDTVISPCDGLIIERIWSAKNICGHTTMVRQIIIIDDYTPPVITFPGDSLLNQSDYDVFITHIGLQDFLFEISKDHVLIKDACDTSIVPVLIVNITRSGNCLDSGYVEKRIYTWTATDVCGNSSSKSITFRIIDNVPPTFKTFPSDLTIVCKPLPEVPFMYAEDDGHSILLSYIEDIKPSVEYGILLVTRTWTAIDSCGNISTVIQRIRWEPNSNLECTIIVPDPIECNSHGNIITSIFTGGHGPVTYEWKIKGSECFIQGGQGTPNITIYFGWTDVEVILIMTDTFGCNSICTATLSCMLTSGDIIASNPDNHNTYNESEAGVKNSNSNVPILNSLSLWPNPASTNFTISFEALSKNDVDCTIFNSLGSIAFHKKILSVTGLNAIDIDTKDFPNGSYTIQLKTRKEVHNKSLLILNNN